MSNPWLYWVGMALTASAMAYGIIAWLATLARLRPAARKFQALPPVTILKPLCGAESGTYECLRSFCDQDYPEFEVIFGVADLNDPVVEIVERLKREFPQRRLQLVIDRRQHGSSRKVSNLMNMMPMAKHEFFVISDSDIRVAPDYLGKIVAPLVFAIDKTLGARHLMVARLGQTGVVLGVPLPRPAIMKNSDFVGG